MSDVATLEQPAETGRVIQMPRRSSPPIRSEAQALWAIIESADYTGTDENGYALMTFRASSRLLDYLESYGAGSAA